ncbi:glycyl-tRNA synthetase beta chain [Tissierella praeacuta DSM 18095]|uniref:Glycine--tRNA ligase beta subunit n=1 Tax=Tissierella praeacuta DSM 18095 TaxID=1123404 RepID=A0A1M4S950_9FIRM|nr:glycine--tRNA ligase subunit beta [Tissierella praeacuta]TCU71733.1 glycyl-tRNA synthetase beta chain [Tissierella praeacuta]SHE28736.1 glycyl-tRNA synthetase beta chain [Tissierella praeacuta DSM 18095]SUP01146.1 Glycine--tRNA ligase beta subunit [Tissierella praeacuta]
MNKSYLLEIGVEELPARFVGDALEQLQMNTSNLFKEERINYNNMRVYSTPRRLTLIIDGLGDKQEDLKETVKGPAKKIAFDEEGNPTKALLGFMRGQGIDISSVYVEEYNGTEYVYANVLKEGNSIEQIISRDMSKIIKSINFPKSMRWGGKNIRFARPIRWLVSLLDDEIVPFNLEGIEASNITKGHRFLGSSRIVINHVNEYIESLRQNFVILDQAERKDIIKYGCEKLAKEKGGNLQQDENLLDEVTNIVEYPTPMIGRIKEEYLSLPADVIITPMKEHLRFFPVLDDKKRLLPYFITVRNGNEDFIETVIKGNEKVLGARLEDAKFFYMDDIKRSLESYVEDLKTIVFQEKLGTLYDKTKRVQNLAVKIGEYLEVGEETEKNIERAGYLSKADLVTKMVSEFTELQGKIGMEYAKTSEENEIVGLAIFEQYLPRFAGDELPTTTAGSVLSIADKMDTISGLFAIDIHPTGSQDPFGLRRQALGIINIILEKKLNLSINELVETALYFYVEINGLAFDYNKVKAEIIEFFNGRIRNMFMDMGIRYDIVDAVISTNIDDIYDMKIRANKLNEWLKKDGLSEMLSAFNRVSNLAEKAITNEVQRDLLTEDEIELYEKFNNMEEKIDVLINKKEYDKALDQLVILKEPIDNFFDKVMVMVEDEKIRNNRLGLLKKIYDKMLQICDLSKIVNK